jgi:hypothetical protein
MGKSPTMLGPNTTMVGPNTRIVDTNPVKANINLLIVATNP